MPALSAAFLACTATTDLGAHDPASSPDAAVASDPLNDAGAAADAAAKPIDGSKAIDGSTPPKGDAGPSLGLAACSGVRGTVDPVTTPTDLPPLVAGRWLFCPAPTPDAFDGNEGIEISAAGRWWFLSADGKRVPGVENGGTWDQTFANAQQPNLIYFRMNVGDAFYEYNLAFEEGPRRIVAAASEMSLDWQAVPAP